MKLFTPSKILLSTLLLLGFTNSVVAEPTLPVSTQVNDSTSQKLAQKDKIEIIPEIKIQAQGSSTPTNKNLKQGDACDDENLEELEGEIFTEIPMAQTIPCNSVECKDLEAADTKIDNYVPLKNAKTISCEK